MLAVGFFVAEKNLVHLKFRRHTTHSYSLFEIPLIAGFFFAPPGAIALAQLVNLSVSLFQRREFVKNAFNFANATFSMGVALLVFFSLADTSGPSILRNMVAAFLAALAFSVLEAVMVVAAMFLATGELPEGSLRRSLGFGVLVSVTNTSLALMATTILWFDPKAATLFLVPTVVVFFAYRTFVWQRRKSESLETLYESTRHLHHSVDSEPATRDLLEQVKNMFRSEVAEFLLFASMEHEAHVRVTLDAEGELHILKSNVLEATEDMWLHVVAQDRAQLIDRPVREPRLAEQLSARGLQDAMIAPLRGEDGVIGTLLVGNRVGETFRTDDLPLFETLANHASVLLANGRLMDRLREEAAEKEYQALHDSLTGLPNRTLFRDRVEHRLASLEQHGLLAILLADLDRFKEVNDTLGHHNGDLLLKEVAWRLRKVLDSDVTVARFSGDEFAILLPSIDLVEDAAAIAQHVLVALQESFELANVEINVNASIGIAVHRLHGDNANKLIQRADVAMYVAKESHSGFEVYSTDRDGYSPARLALASELRQAIERVDLGCSLPAQGRYTNETCCRCRGARSMDSSRARVHASRRVHPSCGTDGPNSTSDHVGTSLCTSPVPPVGRKGIGSRCLGQFLGSKSSRPAPARKCCGSATRVLRRTGSSGSRDHGEQHHGRSDPGCRRGRSPE